MTEYVDSAPGDGRQHVPLQRAAGRPGPSRARRPAAGPGGGARPAAVLRGPGNRSPRRPGPARSAGPRRRAGQAEEPAQEGHQRPRDAALRPAAAGPRPTRGSPRSGSSGRGTPGSAAEPARSPGPAGRWRPAYSRGSRNRTSGTGSKRPPTATGIRTSIRTWTNALSDCRPASVVCRHDRASVGKRTCWKIRPNVRIAVIIRCVRVAARRRPTGSSGRPPSGPPSRSPSAPPGSGRPTGLGGGRP